jgi:leucyl-tRNA synthetase
MSKSKGNVVNPDSFINDYGSDVFRMYLMFMGPYELGGDWSDKGIVGVDRFVQKVYAYFNDNRDLAKSVKISEKYDIDSLSDSEKAVYRKINQTIAKFEEEVENFRFNTAVAALMELTNEFAKELDSCSDGLRLYALERYAIMISPLAPHLGEECWNLLGKNKSLFEEPVWHKADEQALVSESVTIVVQVNGKVRAKLNLAPDSDKAFVKEAAWNDDKVKSHTKDKTVVKEIYVKNKIYNIVVR